MRRAPSAVLWYGLPALALAAVLAYIAAAIALHVNPPVVPIQGVSMRPTLQTGELVLLEGVEPKQIHKGDVIAVNVPKEARQKYSLPSRVVHRVVKIEQTPAGPVFQTKGDGNAGPDVFTVPGSEVVGRMTGHVPGLGYPLLFFRSTQGKILIGAIALIALLYFLMGLFEERQATVQGTALGLQAVLAQTEEIKQAMQDAAAPLACEDTVATPASASEPQAQAIPAPAGRHEENAETLGKLLVAVGEYGEHLRSHTAVMQGLAQATKELRRATEDLRRTTSESSTPLAPPTPPMPALSPTPSPSPDHNARPTQPSVGEPVGRQQASAADVLPSQMTPRTLLLLAVGATATAVCVRRLRKTH